MGLKRDAIGNTLGEQIGNLKGTYWEQGKNEKNTHPNENLAILPSTETSAHHAFRTSEKTCYEELQFPKIKRELMGISMHPTVTSCHFVATAAFPYTSHTDLTHPTL